MTCLGLGARGSHLIPAAAAVPWHLTVARPRLHRQSSDVFQLLLKFPLFKNLRGRLNVPKSTSYGSQADLCTAAAPEAAVTGPVGVGCTLALTVAQARCVSDSELCYCSHLAGHPAGKDLASLLLAEAGSREVALLDEGDNVDDNLMLVENSVNNYGYKRGQVSFAANLDDNDDETACLENSTVRSYVSLL